MENNSSNKHKIKIKRFKPSEHDLYNKIIVVLGPRESGKSFLIKHLITLIREIPMVTVISGTEEMTGHYSSFIPSICVNNDYSSEIIDKFIDRQKKIIKLKKKSKDFKTVDPRALLLLDDLNYDKKTLASKNMRFIFMNGRHAKITFILAMQTVMDIPPALRGNIDYVFMCNFNDISTHKKLFENYTSGFKNVKDFSRVLKSCTVDYNVLAIHKSSNKPSLTDYVFCYKAQEHPNFKFGCVELWQLNGKLYDDNYEVKIKEEEKLQQEEDHRKKLYKRKKEEDMLYSGDNLEIVMED